MIARTWSGTALPEREDDYLAHLENVVLPEIARIQGFRGAYVLRRERKFQVITLWESMDAVREFARDDPDRAVVPPEARAVLSDFDEQVQHFEVVHMCPSS